MASSTQQRSLSEHVAMVQQPCTFGSFTQTDTSLIQSVGRLQAEKDTLVQLLDIERSKHMQHLVTRENQLQDEKDKFMASLSATSLSATSLSATRATTV
jgi:hypothetical protein